MRVLALDTATEACSVALLTDAGVVGAWREVGRGHAELILDNGPCGSLRGWGRLRDAGRHRRQRRSGRLYRSQDRCVGGTRAGIRRGAAGGGRDHAGGVRLASECAPGGAGHGLSRCAHGRSSTGAVLRPIPSTVSPHAGAPAVGNAQSVSVPLVGPFQGIGRGFAAYPVLQSLAGLSLPAGACDALPTQRTWRGLGAIRLKLGEGRDPADLVPVYLRDKVALTEAERARPKQAAPEVEPCREPVMELSYGAHVIAG